MRPQLLGRLLNSHLQVRRQGAAAGAPSAAGAKKRKRVQHAAEPEVRVAEHDPTRGRTAKAVLRAADEAVLRDVLGSGSQEGDGDYWRVIKRVKAMFPRKPQSDGPPPNEGPST